MNASMFRKTLNDIRRSTLWFALGMTIYGLLIAAFYPTIRDSGDDFQELLDQYPEAFLEAFGLSAGVDLSDYGIFLNAEYFSLIWPIIVAAYVIINGANAVAQEIESGTVELWLSVPEVRWKLLLGKVAALSAGAIMLALVTTVTNLIYASVLQADESFMSMALLVFPMSGFALATLGISLACSSFSDSRGRAAGIAAAFVLASYLLNLIANLSDSWDWLRHLSYFHAYQTDRLVMDDVLAVESVLVLLSMWVAGSGLALLIFQRRDIVI